MAGLHIFADPEKLAQGCADFITDAAAKAIADREVFNLALSGGSTPTATYTQLARSSIDWECVHFFWVDERCVHADHPESNFGLAQRSLFSRISIPAENLHRMKGELEPAEAALAYRDELASYFGPDGLPIFDLILLGVGEDGHTASLAPGSSALGAGDQLIVANYLPKLESWRLTMTFPMINAARRVTFLVQGSGKAKVVMEIIEGPKTRLPAAAIRPASGHLDWFLDQDAAALLSRQEISD